MLTQNKMASKTEKGGGGGRGKKEMGRTKTCKQEYE